MLSAMLIFEFGQVGLQAFDFLLLFSQKALQIVLRALDLQNLLQVRRMSV